MIRSVAICFALLLFALDVAAQSGANLVSNGSFEEGEYSPSSWPTDWQWDPWLGSATPTWDDTEAFTGEKSVKIDSPVENDARWIQVVDVTPETHYYLSGWIKTDDVVAVGGSAGANLCWFGTWNRSLDVLGTQDWACNGVRLRSGSESQITVGARLGFWSGTATGTAWFDQVALHPIEPVDPPPNWEILLLLYRDTDFEVTDGQGVHHHYVASMTEDEVEQAIDAATQFVLVDVPALTSGSMVPAITVRTPQPALTDLSPIGGGYWPDPKATGPDLDPRFDSVIVIWDPRATDLDTGENQWIGYADGLTPSRGVGQTYLAMQVDAAIHRNHRNVFKHEFGHSILFYFDAAGTAPMPSVSNHAQATDYVNCLTGEYYAWVDETLDDPIPNSIYNNDSGFTHDYYSGTIATSDQPTRCLGIPPAAWAMGGPVSNSGNPCPAPEPGRLLLLASGVALLPVLHRGRISRRTGLALERV